MFQQAFAGSIPLQGSEIAVRWDSLYHFLVNISIFFFVLVVGAMLYFIVSFRYKPGRKTKYVTGSHLLEGIWIAVPTIMLLGIFVWGYSIYHSMTDVPPDAYEVRVIGKQWLWTFQYDNGKTSVNEVFVPLNRPVKFVMTSEDVLHSFFVPTFRVKQDVLPGMYTSIWFTATVPGKHQVFCTEYCGTSHSGMLAKLVVLDEAQWKAWNRDKKLGEIPNAGEELAQLPEASAGAAPSSVQLVAQTTLAEQGKKVHEAKGCATCHSIDGSTKVGPTFKGLYGTQVELSTGKFILADENFIRDHIYNPQSNTVKGYNPVMPTFKGLITETEMNALIAFIKSIR
jgi:cytochrome c oxidase subunit 2